MDGHPFIREIKAVKERNQRAHSQRRLSKAGRKRGWGFQRKR